MKVFRGCENLQVECLHYTKDLYEQALRFGSVTYHENEKNDDFSKFVFDKILNFKTSPKILELAHITFLYKNISRVNLARLTRDACGAINSESSAIPSVDYETGKILDTYVEPSFIRPMSFDGNYKVKEAYDKIVDATREFIKVCDETKAVSHADRRYAFMQGETISIGIEYNWRQFAGMLNHRLIPAIADEDFVAAARAFYALEQRIEDDYKNGKLDNSNYVLWKALLKKALPAKFFVDEMIGDQFNKGHNVVGDVPETPIYDKKKCQLYYELKQMTNNHEELMLKSIGFKQIAEEL